MKQTRHIEVSVERHEISVVRRNQRAVSLRCPTCGVAVLMMTVETAATLTGMTPRTIFRRMEESKLHFHESESGLILICSESCKTLT